MGGICVDNKRAGNALAVGIVKVVIIEQAVDGRFKSIGFGKNDRKGISVWIEHQLKGVGSPSTASPSVTARISKGRMTAAARSSMSRMR